MEKRYQVFVSSTYEDLTHERQEVMHALLELDCIPAGMELFPAANEDQWSLIRKVIDESDYYVVISAGRYGTIGPQGHSYTEMEYRYAIETGKPTIAFLHKDPLQLAASNVEKTDAGREKLESFRKLLQQKLCKHWSTPGELGSVVSRSLVSLTRRFPAVGWIRADQVTDALMAGVILKHKQKIEELEARLEQARNSAPSGSEKLAQGDDTFNVDFSFDMTDAQGEEWSWNYQVDVRWNEIFYDVGPLLLDEATERQIELALNDTVRNRSRLVRQKDEALKGYRRIRNFQISDHDFQTIKVQLRAIGLMVRSQRSRSVKDSETYWTLTPYGDQVLTTLRAIRRDESSIDPVPSSDTEDPSEDESAD